MSPLSMSPSLRPFTVCRLTRVSVSLPVTIFNVHSSHLPLYMPSCCCSTFRVNTHLDTHTHTHTHRHTQTHTNTTGQIHTHTHTQQDKYTHTHTYWDKYTHTTGQIHT